MNYKPLIMFVLLYYKAFEDTIECINSIERLSRSNCEIRIIVVDNYSNDGFIEKLVSKYEYNNHIVFLQTNSNLGFAKGNNYGIVYAKKHFSPDFIVAINTDAVIKQPDFCDRIVKAYEETGFYVMGPKVIGYMSGEFQSPLCSSDDNKRFIKDYFLNNAHLWAWKTNTIHLIRKVRHPDNSIKTGARSFDREHCVCSGSCLIFSKLFLRRWDGFFEGTFLYREERILFYVMDKLQCKTLYYEQLEVLHKGGTSTDVLFGGDDKRKAIRFYTIRRQSMKKESKIRLMTKGQMESILISSVNAKKIIKL